MKAGCAVRQGQHKGIEAVAAMPGDIGTPYGHIMGPGKGCQKIHGRPVQGDGPMMHFF